MLRRLYSCRRILIGVRIGKRALDVVVRKRGDGGIAWMVIASEERISEWGTDSV